MKDDTTAISRSFAQICARMPPSTNFERAIQVQTESAGNTYLALLEWDWSVGTAPNGGYIAAIFYRASRVHFDNTHPQRHAGCARPIAMQLSYIRRCQIGPAVLIVKDLKLGSRISLIHITLFQENRSAVVGYVTVSDEVSETGISVPTNWKIDRSSAGDNTVHSPPLVESDGVKEKCQSPWKKVVIANPGFRRASSRVELYERKDDTADPTSGGQWARLRPQGQEGGFEKWTMESVAFLTDILPTALGHLERVVHVNRKRGDNVSREPAPVWFPTLALNIDFKKCIVGVKDEWLYSHVHIKSVQNGRMDVEVAIIDASEEIVAVSTQAVLVMSSERNTVRRNRRGSL